jgi:hypothetical protein
MGFEIMIYVWVTDRRELNIIVKNRKEAMDYVRSNKGKYETTLSLRKY